MRLRALTFVVFAVGLLSLLSALMGFFEGEEAHQLPSLKTPRDSSQAPVKGAYTGHSAPRVTTEALPVPQCSRPILNSTWGDAFGVEVCTDAMCAGNARIFVKDCMKSSPKVLSNNETTSKWLRAGGPDTIRVRVSGPEIHAGIAGYHGDCVYEYSFSVGVGGVYNLAIERLYKDFEGVNEAFSRWPQLLKESLLPNRAPVTNYHHTQRTLESNYHFECTRSETSAIRPLCTGREVSHRGRWVVQSGSEMHTRVRVRKIQKNPIVFKWAIASEPEAWWEPLGCRIRRAPEVVADALSSLNGRRIVVAGDSQLRALYFGLVNVLNGHGKDCVQNITTVDAEPPFCIPNVKGSHRKRAGGIQIDFFDDTFLDKFASSSKYDGYDIIIVGFAQHPASKDHWPYGRYTAAVDIRRRRVERYVKNGKEVIWYLAPQYPHTTSGYPVAVKDWRTDPRLVLFNSYAEERMRSAGARIVDGFAISTGMSHSSPDQAHYTNFVSYETVQLLLTGLV